MHIRRIGMNTIVITWSADDFDQYQIRYWPMINDTTKMLVTLAMNNLTLITTSDNYRVQLRGHVKLAGWTAYTEAKLVSLRSMAIDGSLTSDTSRTLVDNKSILLIGPFSILGLIITVILLALTYSKQYAAAHERTRGEFAFCYRKRSCRLKTASDCESLDYQKRQGQLMSTRTNERVSVSRQLPIDDATLQH